MEYAALPPDVASGLVYTGPQSAPLAAAAAAWQALAADLGATATAMQTAVADLVGASWTGPTSVRMGGAGQQHVQWLVQAAAQAEETAGLAAQAAGIVDAVFTGVAPPPLIAANRAALVTLIGTNFMGCNSGAIAANQAHYQGMWAQDSTALYSYAGDSAGVVGGLVPFTPIAPTVNPAGAADQAASVADAAGQSAGNVGQKTATVSNQLGGNSTGGASDIMSMAPQFLSSVPQVLQGMAQPLMSANPMSSLGSFSSLLSPFMSGLGGSGMGGTPALAAATSPLTSTMGGAGGGLGGIGGGTGALSAAMGGAPKLGGLSVPATWAASAQSAGGSNNATSATSGINANSAAAPNGASGGMGGGAAPMGAMGGRNQSGGNGPSYGSPIRVLPRPR